MYNSDNLIVALKSQFHLQRDGYNSGVAAPVSTVVLLYLSLITMQIYN